MDTRLARRSVALLIALVALAACKKKEAPAGDTMAMAPSGATTGAMPSTSATTGATAAAAPGALTDVNIVFILDQANAADSARGALAATKGTSADVRNFGKLMVGEHHALRQQGQDLAKKLNVTPAAPAGDMSEMQAKAELDSLNAMPKGKAWDKAYIDYEVTAHQQVLETAGKAKDAAQAPELKDLIGKASPVIQKHLDRAKEIQSKQGS